MKGGGGGRGTGTMRGGRIGSAGPGGGRGLPFKPRVYMPRHPFDLVLCEAAFPRCKPHDDTSFSNALMERHNEISPKPNEQTDLVNFVTRIQAILENLVVNPGNFESCQLEEVRQVGPFKEGTLLTSEYVADIVVVLKTLPTRAAVDALKLKVCEELRQQPDQQGFVADQSTPEGFDLSSNTCTVHLLVTTVPKNMRSLDPELHLAVKTTTNNLAMIRHTRWIEENAHHSSIKVLIRILRDLRARFTGLQSLTQWQLVLLAHSSIMSNPSRQALPLNVSFRRVIQLLSAGLFLPGSAGITDPCENGNNRIHTSLSLDDQDLVCLTAQTLLRVIAHGGYKKVLGLEPMTEDLSVMNVWDGVVMSPLERAYEKPTDAKPGDVEDMEAENEGGEEAMETSESDP